MRLNVIEPEREARGRAVVPVAEPSFSAALAAHGLGTLRAGRVTTLQVNVGKRCNQACHHCHVDAGPLRTETMAPAAAERVVALARASDGVDTVDITGGAPELHASFRWLVRATRALGLRVIDRCNLTILFEPGQEDLAEFLAAQGVQVIASLPCYGPDNVEKQRGKGVFDKSIEALRRLNALGYAVPGSGLGLDLVYNPVGAFLPPAQAPLEASYKEQLRAGFRVEFGRLLTLTNMPIHRFAHALARDGNHEAYMSLLVSHFNPVTVEHLMCRSLVSVGYDGTLYDCDFNQMAELPVADTSGAPRTIWTVDSLADLDVRAIAVASHCFGCTAGSGSSCGGALA